MLGDEGNLSSFHLAQRSRIAVVRVGSAAVTKSCEALFRISESLHFMSAFAEPAEGTRRRVTSIGGISVVFPQNEKHVDDAAMLGIVAGVGSSLTPPSRKVEAPCWSGGILDGW